MKSLILMLKMVLSKTELGLDAFKIWLCTSFQFYKTQNRKLDEGRRKRREEVGGKGGKKGHQ